MTGFDRNPHPYVIYKLGALTVTVSDRACDSCGRNVQALRYATKRRSGGSVVVCWLCMKYITEEHIEYMQLRRGRPS